MAAVLKGVTVLFGVAVQAGISNFICQSVGVDKAFELNDKVPDETGVTITLRYDGVERTGTVEGIAKTEVWLEVRTTDIAAAAEHLKAAHITRCDEVEPLPEGMAAFWIKNPAGVVHLVTEE
jgi:hypothetical protein